MTVQILRGDCRVTLAGLPAECAHTCVTSPPYWGLRDYGTEPLDWPAIAYAPIAGIPPVVEVPAMRCSLGLEPTIEAFIGHMILVFREVRRVLRDDGTAWVNMGDCYATGAGKVNTAPGGGTQGERWAGIRGEDKVAAIGPMTQPNRMPQAGLKPKDLVGQPWRLALALQADGWWLRCDVIWDKPNPMPESTKDRPTKAHEYIFLLAKSERYYFNADAIKEPASIDTHARYARGRSDTHKHAQAALVPGAKPQTIAQGFEHMRKADERAKAWKQDMGSNRTLIEGYARKDYPAEGDHETDEEQDSLLGEKAHQPGNDSAYADGKGARMGRGAGWRARKLAEANSGTKNNESFDAAMAVMPDMRNKRTVWRIPTEGYPEAHFATYPTKLVEPCILAGCPPDGTVLDPFGGSATTGLVADRLGRNAILCELNPAYADMGERRIAKDAGHVSRQIQMEA